MSKTKRKTSNQAPEILLWEQPFEFTSLLPMNECALRLEQARHDGAWGQRRKVMLVSEDEDSVLFQLSQPGGKLGDGWAVGRIQAWDDETTRITAEIGISPEILVSVFIALIGFMFTACYGIVSMASGAATFVAMIAFVTAVVIAVIVFSARWLRTTLTEYLANLFEIDG